MKRTKRTLSLLIALAMVLLSATTAFAGTCGTYSIFGDDDRTVVKSTSGSNYSICKIFITFSDNSKAVGTGFLTSSNKVVTAGHCLYYKDTSGNPKTAKSLKLWFGCSGTNSNPKYTVETSVTCTTDNIYVPSQWKTGYPKNYDYGVIKLDEDFSGPTQYFSLASYSNCSEGDTVTITGYEDHYKNTKFTNYDLVQGTGKITGTNGSLLYTKIDAMAGQSGSPVVYKGNVIGVYTYSVANADKNIYLYPDDSPENNTITGLTQTALKAIENF